ncbi:MAG: WD40 repeat domain-containing protein [Planctomycetia bacterium]|nr:WD40 repeat domain-containing protein [Planctomycetia bacterium]
MLADRIREQFTIPEFFLWPAECFEHTDFSDPRLTGGDSIQNVGSAWASLATGLLLAKRQIVPSKNVFASMQYDFTNQKIASVDLIKQKISVIADFAPSTLFVAPEQLAEARNALADLVSEEQDDERREFLSHLEIKIPQGSDPFSMVRAMAFADLNTLAMENRVRELIDLEEHAIRECRINEAFEFFKDRIQLKKNLAFSVSSIEEKTITTFYNRTKNMKICEREVSLAPDIPVAIPEGMTHVLCSPSGKQKLAWRSNSILNLEMSQFTPASAAAALTDAMGHVVQLELPFSVPFHAVWNSSETQIAILCKSNDSVKLILFSLSTSSCLEINDFGGHKPMCMAEIFFSPDDQFLFVRGINNLVFFYETKTGMRIAGPFVATGTSQGNPWSVSPVGCVFLCNNALNLFHISERRLYTLITFAASPDRLCFHQGHCSAAIGDHVWLFDGNSGFLIAPLFKSGPVDSIRLESNQTIIFAKNGKEQVWQWQNVYSHCHMFPTDAKQCHAIAVAPDESIWLRHDDNKLVIIDTHKQKTEIFTDVVYIWPGSNTFLVNDTSSQYPQLWNRSGKKRLCKFEIPFAGKIQSDSAGRYLLLTSTLGLTPPMASAFRADSPFGLNHFPGKTTICYNLQTDSEVWRRTFTNYPESMAITDDGHYTIIPEASGDSLFYDNETGQLTNDVEIVPAFWGGKLDDSPVQNGYYQSEQILCEYYDKYRDWFWLATATGRVLTLERETLHPTVVTFQFYAPVQTIAITENQYAFGMSGYVVKGTLLP